MRELRMSGSDAGPGQQCPGLRDVRQFGACNIAGCNSLPGKA